MIKPNVAVKQNKFFILGKTRKTVLLSFHNRKIKNKSYEKIEYPLACFNK